MMRDWLVNIIGPDGASVERRMIYAPSRAQALGRGRQIAASYGPTYVALVTSTPY